MPIRTFSSFLSGDNVPLRLTQRDTLETRCVLFVSERVEIFLIRERQKGNCVTRRLAAVRLPLMPAEFSKRR